MNSEGWKVKEVFKGVKTEYDILKLCYITYKMTSHPLLESKKYLPLHRSWETA